MIKTDLHCHTKYCDGSNTAEEMVCAAIEIGLDVIGISGHSYVPHAKYSMSPVACEAYKAELAKLRIKYKDKISVLCGVEQDLFSEYSTDGFDYVIASVHSIKTEDGYFDVDKSPESFAENAKKYFNSDYYALCEAYYENVEKIAYMERVDIVGHVDLVTKFNEGSRFFDESHPRYVAAYRKAIDRVIHKCKVFEINTGAISRGYRSTPYPSKEILDYILQKGGCTILNSDAHSKDTLCYEFDKWSDM